MPAKLVLAEAGSRHPLLNQGQRTDFSASDGKLAHYLLLTQDRDDPTHEPALLEISYSADPICVSRDKLP